MTTTEPVDLAGALDAVLASPAHTSLRRFVPDASAARMVTHLARHPRVVAGRGRELADELGRIATGASALVPQPRDRRFADAAWQGNPLLRRTMQAYLAGTRTLESLVDDADLDWRDLQRVRFLVENLVEAAAPSNNPLLNPLAWKTFIDTGGRNAVKGIRNLLSDLRSAPRVPSMVDPNAFDVGTDLATTPGAVVFRSDVFELIQYAPQTETVYEHPLLIVPPTINKFYVLDLAPERSMVEYLVRQGQQVFVISWRNPDARHAAWDIDTYGQAVIDALDAVEQVSGADKAVLTGICSGGILASLVMGHLTAIGRADRIAGFGLAVTMLDQHHAGQASALMDDATATAAVAASKARGYVDGRALAEVFAWLRPSDLVWNYWVNNYLLGKQPPAFDILYWNSDTTRMTAGLHRDFIDMATKNAISDGTASMLGSTVDLKQVGTDSYVVAAITDHICPWQTCYQSTQLLGGQTRFVLSNAGHIAAMVNPPTNPKASFYVADQTPASPKEWEAAATKQAGSWWPDFAAWLAERGGARKPAPTELGSIGHQVLAPAPGTYVIDN
jgi:polyhydroxyalkanoate synthase